MFIMFGKVVFERIINTMAWIGGQVGLLFSSIAIITAVLLVGFLLLSPIICGISMLCKGHDQGWVLLVIGFLLICYLIHVVKDV